MIAIVSSSVRERAAFASLCETHRWACAECDSVRAFRKLLRHTRVQTVLGRHRLGDGYADDVIAALTDARLLATAKIIVLLPSGTPPSQEARLVKLGADCVLRDPVRTEVLFEYLAKYQQSPAGARAPVQSSPQKILPFAGGRVFLDDREWRNGSRSTRITPREIDLIEVLLHSDGRAVSYHNLFSEILGRRFRGETANLRVLLGLLTISARRVGVRLRDWVEVIPKLGYRYPRRGTPSAHRTARPRRPAQPPA